MGGGEAVKYVTLCRVGPGAYSPENSWEGRGARSHWQIQDFERGWGGLILDTISI